jgi:glycosyltransferase involved in cell wall biosynthesis
MPPMAMGPLWTRIAREYRLPLILDLRDAWSQWQIAPYPTLAHYHLTVRLERQCLTSAAHVICTSEQTREDLLALHPNIQDEKILTITNGYDADVADWALPAMSNPNQETEPYIIGYVGSFYYSPAARKAMFLPWWRKRCHQMLQYASRKEDWLYRSPFFFFRTVARMLAERPDLRQRIRIRFAGHKPDWLDEQIEEFHLQELVEHVGYLSHEEALDFENECDSLLITSAKVIGASDDSIAGKTFEYFVARKPILGFVTEGAQRDILQKSGMALIFDPDDAESSAEQLAALVDGKVVLTPNETLLTNLHRRELTGHLADIMYEVKAGLS